MESAGDVRRARIIIDFWGAPRVRGDTNTDNSDTTAISRASPDLGLGIGYTLACEYGWSSHNAPALWYIVLREEEIGIRADNYALMK